MITNNILLWRSKKNINNIWLKNILIWRCDRDVYVLLTYSSLMTEWFGKAENLSLPRVQRFLFFSVVFLPFPYMEFRTGLIYKRLFHESSLYIKGSTACFNCKLQSCLKHELIFALKRLHSGHRQLIIIHDSSVIQVLCEILSLSNG